MDDGESQILQMFLTTTRISEGARSEYLRCLREGANLNGNDVFVFTDEQLHNLVINYDRQFFAGALRKAVASGTLRVGFSNRLRRTAGKTRRLSKTRNAVQAYEISINKQLLMDQSPTQARPAKVGGLLCADADEVLMRILEHEMVHLAEYIAWGVSDCDAFQFQSIVMRFFGHTTKSHELLGSSTRTILAADYRVGQYVTFSLAGAAVEGKIVAITENLIIEVPTRGAQRSEHTVYRYSVPPALVTPIAF
jgi:hypothetical protein